jgi:hypothetical protein
MLVSGYPSAMRKHSIIYGLLKLFCAQMVKTHLNYVIAMDVQRHFKHAVFE